MAAATALREAGNGHFRARRFVAAAESYSAALEAAESRDERAALLNNRALASLHAGDVGGSIADASAVLELEPGNVKALMRRAMAHVQLQEHDRAVADYTAALRHDPRRAPVEQPAWVPLALVRRALALESLGRIDALRSALGDLEAARACVLPADLLRLATDGCHRIEHSLRQDAALTREHPADEGLVRGDQLLRLSFSSTLPSALCLGERLVLSVHVANELGCWRRADFHTLFAAVRPRHSPACRSVAAQRS